MVCMPPAACHVDPHVSSSRSRSSASVQPNFARWYNTEQPTTPPPMTTYSGVRFACFSLPPVLFDRAGGSREAPSYGSLLPISARRRSTYASSSSRDRGIHQWVHAFGERALPDSSPAASRLWLRRAPNSRSSANLKRAAGRTRAHNAPSCEARRKNGRRWRRG